MKKQYSILITLLFLIFAPVLLSHELKIAKRLYKSRFNTRNIKNIPKIFAKKAITEGWNLYDWSWLLTGSEDNIDDLIDVNLYITSQNSPYFYLLSSIFDGYIWKEWDGWSKITVENGDNTFISTFDSEGRITSYTVNNLSFSLEYDSKNNLTEWITYEWDSVSDSWIGEYKHVYSYNSEDNLTEEIFYWHDEESATLLKDEKIDFIYNSDGNLTEEVFSYWDYESGTWNQIEKNTFSFNSDGNLIEEISYEWDDLSGIWEKWGKNTYSYNFNGNITEDIYYWWNDRSGTWGQEDKFTYSYNSDGNLSEDIYYWWDDESGTWIQEDKFTYSYNSNGNLSEVFYYYWDYESGTSEISNKLTFGYDSNGNLLEELFYEWNIDSGTWEKWGKNTYSYNSNGNPDTCSMYDLMTDEWVLDDQQIVTFEYGSAIKPVCRKSVIKNGINIKLQPFNKSIEISAEGLPLKNDILKIYDFNGRIISEIRPVSARENTVYTWDYTGNSGVYLANKIYLFVLCRGNSIITHKITPLFFR